MARPLKPHSSSHEALSNASSSSEEEEQVNEQISEEEDEEELEAVVRPASSDYDEDDDKVAGDNPPNSDEYSAAADDLDGDSVDPEISKQEKTRLKEIMQKVKKQKIQEILDAQNAAIDTDMLRRPSFAHFAKGDQSSSQKKSRGRGRHSSNFTEEEDEEYRKGEEDGLANTRLVTQPSFNYHSVFGSTSVFAVLD
ncbi:ISWI chromatin-remodeling complex ATPase CHR11 isoform B [Glycine soja]|uniref:ISWI chromatin-remodeling complex ATPase CHR11 isoform B n=1 Tax=Glycine soja TaxID=3848 RepID=A0A445K6P5_GLYSO|nr:ISWI chromatin-remodeling complex ATPase CHR11 isoform B [Glycine soja]